MTTRTLRLAVYDPEDVAVGVDQFSGQGLEVVRCNRVEEAVDNVTAKPPPDALFLISPPKASLSLELVALIKDLEPRLPIWVVIQQPDGQDPVDLAPGLLISTEMPSSEALSSALDGSIQALAKADTSLSFRVADYLELAHQLSASASLHFRLETGGEALVEVIDGEPWNAYSEEGEGLVALESSFESSVERLTITSLRRPPVDHQMIQVFDHSAMESATAEVPEEDLRSFREQTGSLASASPEATEDLPKPDALEAEAPPATDKDFDQLFNEGLHASLSRNYEEALKLFERAAELRPDDSRVSYNLTRLRNLQA